MSGCLVPPAQESRNMCLHVEEQDEAQEGFSPHAQRSPAL